MGIRLLYDVSSGKKSILKIGINLHGRYGKHGIFFVLIYLQYIIIEVSFNRYVSIISQRSSPLMFVCNERYIC